MKKIILVLLLLFVLAAFFAACGNSTPTTSGAGTTETTAAITTKDPNAVKYDEITYQEIIEKNLQVMDQTAISLCKENNMPLFVFNMNEKGNIYKACKGQITGTIVK